MLCTKLRFIERLHVILGSKRLGNEKNFSFSQLRIKKFTKRFRIHFNIIFSLSSFSGFANNVCFTSPPKRISLQLHGKAVERAFHHNYFNFEPLREKFFNSNSILHFFSSVLFYFKTIVSQTFKINKEKKPCLFMPKKRNLCWKFRGRIFKHNSGKVKNVPKIKKRSKN